MSVLVTGGAGYIGSHMILALLDQGEEVVVIDNLSTGFRNAVPPTAHLAIGEASDIDLIFDLNAKYNIDAIIHFAGSILVPESISDPLRYYFNNTVTSQRLIEAAVKIGVKHFIFSSSAGVYGIPNTIPIPEDAPLNSISPYGASKMMTERMLQDTAAAHDLRYVSLRYFNVAGADPDGRAGQSTTRPTHVIKVACQVALGIQPYMNVFGTDYDTADGTCVRDYIHVNDLIMAHLAALNYLRADGTSDVLNCGYGYGYSVQEVINAVKKISGRDFPIRPAERRIGDPPTLVAAVERIHKRLNWSPAYNSLDTIIHHALKWEEKTQRL